MKKLMFFAVVAMIGASAFATDEGGNWPRVYQYSASLNTAVAKNAKTVTYPADCQLDPDFDICYRVKGKVSLKGVIVFGCDCVEGAKDADLVLVGTSADKYTQIVEEDSFDIWAANRLGSPINSKAKVAELGFDLTVTFGATNACNREFDLWHAGFGTAGSINGEETLDILTISGNVVGEADAPYCSADEGNCPRCVGGRGCATAIAFDPCDTDWCDTEGNDADGVAYGTFTLKYNKTLALAIKDIPADERCETAAVLVPKVFGKNAKNPLGPCLQVLPSVE